MPRMGVVGHSNAVAFLDAVADWRAAAGMGDWVPDGYSADMAGWFSRAHGAVFEFVPKPEFAAFGGTKTALFTAEVGPLELATLRDADGTPAVDLSPQLQRCLIDFQECDTVISLIYGGEARDLSLINYYPAYDFAPYGAAGEAGEDPQPVDFQYILGLLLPKAMRILLPLRIIKAALPGVRVIHMAPVPPLEFPDRIRHVEMLGPAIARFGFTRPALRLKWHYAFREELRRLLQQSGILLINEPDEAVTARGFLRDDYAASLNHANAAYGALLAAQIGRLLFG